MLNPRGKGAREVRRAIFRGTPSIPVLREHEGAAVLPVVDTYKHLGVVQSYDGSIRAEVKQRCAQAWSAFREGRTRVFRCKRVALARRGALLEVLVMSKLRFGCGAWPPLGITESKLFSGAVTGIYRATLGLSRQDDQHVSLETMCALLRQPDPFTILRVEQLRYLRQLIAHAPDALWALLRQDVPFIAMLRDTLAWLYARIGATTRLPHPLEDWQPWCHVCRDRPGLFRGMVKRVRGLEMCRLQCFASLQALYAALRVASDGVCLAQDPDRRVFTDACLLCKKGFEGGTSCTPAVAAPTGGPSWLPRVLRSLSCMIGIRQLP